MAYMSIMKLRAEAPNAVSTGCVPASRAPAAAVWAFVALGRLLAGTARGRGGGGHTWRCGRARGPCVPEPTGDAKSASQGEEEPALCGLLGPRDRALDRCFLGGGDGAADLLVAHGFARSHDLRLGGFRTLDQGDAPLGWQKAGLVRLSRSRLQGSAAGRMTPVQRGFPKRPCARPARAWESASGVPRQPGRIVAGSAPAFPGQIVTAHAAFFAVALDGGWTRRGSLTCPAPMALPLFRLCGARSTGCRRTPVQRGRSSRRRQRPSEQATSRP